MGVVYKEQLGWASDRHLDIRIIMKCQFILLVGKFQEVGHTLLLIGVGAALGLMGRLAFLLHLSPYLGRFPVWFPRVLP